MRKKILPAICIAAMVTMPVQANEMITQQRMEQVSTESLMNDPSASLLNGTGQADIPETGQMTLNEFRQSVSTQAEGFQNIDMESVFKLMQNSLDAGEDISLSNALSLSGLTVPDNFMYDLSECGLNGTLDTSLLNLEYASLLSGMDEEYKAADFSSQSQGAVSLFNSNYGDLSESLKTTEYSLPEGFSMKEMVKSNNKTINASYKEAYKESGYKNVRKSMDVSGIFQQAANGPAVYSNTDASTLSGQAQSASSGAKSSYESKKSTSQADTNKKLYGPNGAAANYQKKTAQNSKDLKVDDDGHVTTKNNTNKSVQAEYNDKAGENAGSLALWKDTVFNGSNSYNYTAKESDSFWKKLATGYYGDKLADKKLKKAVKGQK